MLRRWLDALVLRGPFRGRDAARYLAVHRGAFGDLDERLVRRLAAEHAGARVIADVGAGDGRLARALAAALPDATVIAVEPSADLAAHGVRALAERLPLASGSVDLAILLSSLRHVGDRRAALIELRRVVRAGGTVLIVELDPEADPSRRRAHEAGIASPVARLSFAPIVLGLAPPAGEIAELARGCGWRVHWEPDPVQPFYWMWLSGERGQGATMSRVGELRRLVDEAVDADWRHPAWWAFLAGTAALERLARPADGELYAAFLGANGGPRADTFMAVPVPPAADRWREAVRRARAAWAAIARLDGTLPGQPLRVALAQRGGWLRAEPLGGGMPVAFETEAGIGYGDVSDDGLTPDRLRPEPVAAPVLVSLLPQPLGECRHLHRRAWSGPGGPWLGVGDAGGLGVVTTCHLAVDGYGHAQLTRAVFPEPAAAPESVRAEGEMGFAAVVVPRVSFVAAAHALALTLTEIHGARGSRSPSFQIPFVAGDRDDADRLRRRVSFALVSLRLADTREAFGVRLRAQLDREAREAGLLTRILAATVNAPFPEAVRRRLLAGNREPSPLLPPTEALAGRASLAYLRFPEAERPAAPLYAASSPPVWDRTGSVSMTLVDHGDRTTASVAGTGHAGTREGAAAFLERWRRLL